ncbi:hypothetical protein CRE_14184 [Caenorhabditis remanei]|uniref:Uncharacterized protein n=1 Tax=Caenorhabditis remanei TaxID=31234 RepID=E3N1J4_CAERE|nr:hypothetical protein CRE_14184 [Caenorhabditis remanei]
MMMKEANGAAGNGIGVGGDGQQGFRDFNYMNMMQPIHLARHPERYDDTMMIMHCQKDGTGRGIGRRRSRL